MLNFLQYYSIVLLVQNILIIYSSSLIDFDYLLSVCYFDSDKISMMQFVGLSVVCTLPRNWIEKCKIHRKLHHIIFTTTTSNNVFSDI